MTDFFDDSNEEFGDFGDYLGQSTSEHTIFLIDASKQMLEEINTMDLEGFEPSDTYMDVALKVVRELMKQHIISSPRDQMGVIFYGAAEPKNDSSFEKTNIAMGVDELTADRIREVEALQENFQDAIGAADELTPEDVRDGFWAATQILQEDKGKAARRVMVFTNNDNPFPDASSDAREQIVSRVEALHEAKIETELFNLTPGDAEFSMDFWGEIIKNPEDELGTQTFNVEPLRLQDLAMNIRRKAYKKRALASLQWYIGPEFNFAVKLYALVQKATASKSIPIDLRTNEVLKTSTTMFDDDTGAIVEKVTKYSFPKDEKQAPRFPKVIFTPEERQALKQLASPGIRLIGFKSLKTLKPYYQLRGATFVYPDERAQKGSATIFIALHDRMLNHGVYALCSIVRSKSSEPRLVAAVPQQEEIDEHGTQVVPPGINLIWLPYKDDIRHPDTDRSFLGPDPGGEPTAKQVQAAAALLESMKIDDFAVGTLPNPHLQRHYQVVEALALGEEPPEMKPEDDQTRPEPLNEEQLAAAVAFRDAVYGKGNKGPLKAVLKRKAEDQKTQELDVKELVKEGTLAKLTVKVLMDLCRQQRLSTTGRKAELIERLTQKVAPS